MRLADASIGLMGVPFDVLVSTFEFAGLVNYPVQGK